jgi:hypothetical protein
VACHLVTLQTVASRGPRTQADGRPCWKDGRCAQSRWSVCTVAAVDVHCRRSHGRPRTAALAAFWVEMNGGAGRASRLAGRRSASLPGTSTAATGPVTGVRLFPRQVLPGRPPAPRTTEISGPSACKATSANGRWRPVPLHDCYHRA